MNTCILNKVCMCFKVNTKDKTMRLLGIAFVDVIFSSLVMSISLLCTTSNKLATQLYFPALRVFTNYCYSEVFQAF